MKFVVLPLAAVVFAAPVAASAATTEAAVSATSSPAAGIIEVVGAGTPIPIHLVSPISSASVHVGDVFAIASSKEVDVGGRVVIIEGAQGQGEIVSVSRAGGNGHSGAVKVKYDWIYAADGGKVKLSDTVDSREEEDRKGASSTATFVGIATFGIGGLFGHNFAHGREMVIDEQKKLTAFVAENVHVTTSSLAGAGYDR